MPLQSIIVIVLRLFAIQFLFSSIVSIVTLWGHPSWRMAVFPSICWLIAAFLVWFLAQPLGRLVTKGYDVPVQLGGLTRQDLYCFAFVFVGLGSFLHGLASSLTTMGVMIADSTATSFSQHIDPYLVRSVTSQLPRQLTEFLVGLVAVVFASRWAKKLAGQKK